MILEIDRDAYLEATNIVDGVFSPLNGFMKKDDYKSVIKNMYLSSGEVWTLPVTLDLKYEQIGIVEKNQIIQLSFEGNIIGKIIVEDIFEVDLLKDSKTIFGTADEIHPGVAKELSRSRYRLGGKVLLKHPYRSEFSKRDLTPEKSKKIFKEKKWLKITAFQTRNPPHRAHEYLQRIAMEVSDGILIQPLLGWKKPGDFTPEAIIGAYEIMIKEFYPEHALLATLHTPMRYAGPREAVFHALLRRNYGCTAFIVGRDHAGVGNYYNKYEAQKLALSLEREMGIEILALAGPRYCSRCETISTEKTCSHKDLNIQEISGTEMRKYLSRMEVPPEIFMRKEISEYLIQKYRQGNLFCR